jgi:hypothetical protein
MDCMPSFHAGICFRSACAPPNWNVLLDAKVRVDYIAVVVWQFVDNVLTNFVFCLQIGPRQESQKRVSDVLPVHSKDPMSEDAVLDRYRTLQLKDV